MMKTRLNNGFTLIELLAVILIMGIMMAIGLFALPKLTKADTINSSVKSIVHGLECARQMAIASHTPTRLVLSYSCPTADQTLPTWQVAISNTYYASSWATAPGSYTSGSTWILTEVYGNPRAGVIMGGNTEILGWPPGYYGDMFVLERQGTYCSYNNTEFTWANGSRLRGHQYNWRNWFSFDKYGRAECSATLALYPQLSRHGADLNTQNKAYISTTAGSSRIYVKRS